MPLLKIENADVQSSAPYVFDVMDREWIAATHILKFGDYVMVNSLDNLRTITLDDVAARHAEEQERIRNDYKKAMTLEEVVARDDAEEKRSVRAAKAFADAATQRPRTKAKSSVVAKHK